VYRRGEVGQVARALRILDALRGFKHGRCVSELATEVGMSERTVKRDLEALQDAGIDVSRQPIDGRAAARLKDRAYSYVVITKRERYTLLAVRRMFDVLKGTSFAEDVESVLRKLEQRMTPEERAEHATFGERFAYLPAGGTKRYTDKDDIINTLLSGVLSRKLVRYAYTAARGRPQRGILAPFAMLLHKHGLYVLGKRLSSPADASLLDAGEVVNWALERFTEAEWLRNTSFVPPATFKLEDHVDDMSGVHVGKGPPQRVVVEFSKERAAYARARTWHRTQELEDQPDGAVRITFWCRNLAPLTSWILEWGLHAKVIEPKELEDDVVRELQGALRLYGTGHTA
jgi:predicted DNA-binding transcriptional regulator YafY